MEYRGRPVWIEPPNFGDGVEHGQLDDFSYDAPGGGHAIPWKVTIGTKRTLTLPFLISDYDDMKRWRAWWAAREGRRRAFWVPTWLTDFIAVEDYVAGDIEIRVRFTGLGTKLTFSSQFRHLAMMTRAGKMEFYRIDAHALDGEEEVLTLDHVLESDLIARDTVICGLMYARLADDEIEYEYVAGNVAHVELKFVELPTETEGDDNDGMKPAWLYIIQQGATIWRFTTYPIDQVVGGQTYYAAAIEHGEITEDIDFTGDGFSLTVSTDDATHPLRQFLDPAFVMLTSLSIYEIDVDAEPPLSLPSAPIYKGRIEGANFRRQGTIDVKVSTLMRISETQTPQAISERTCVHQTYDQYCGLSAAAFTTVGTLTALNSSPPWIEAAAFGAKATAEADPNWFALGMVTIGSEQRFCTRQAGNRLYLNAPFRSAIVGNSASALAGDDKRVETCDGKFDNVTGNAKGFLGFPWMPNKNPQFEALETPKPKGGKK
jgi:hypothetical protein